MTGSVSHDLRFAFRSRRRRPGFMPVFTAVALALVAFVACWVPARRAARMDPMLALKSE